MTEQPLTLGSLFDGSGGFPLGGLLAGITPVWASEIEPFPIRVTTKRLPFMKHYGDITAMDGSVIEPVDIITFGSPCTDLSVAGRRAGLGGKQSCLFYQAIRIIKEMRSATNGRYPRWICWENVPGAFSSNGGRDFQAVLEAVIGIVQPGTTVPSAEKSRWPQADAYVGDGWCVAYRTLDAQHWGLPQRRKRVFLVASLTDQSAWKILFKSEGLSGYSAEGFRAWQAATQSSSACLGAAGVDGHHGRLTRDVTLALNLTSGSPTGRNSIILNDQGGSVMDVSENVTATLRAQDHGHPPCVMELPPTAKLIPFRRSTRPHSKEEAPTWQAADIANTLNTFDVGESRCNELAVSTFGICANGSEGMKSVNPHVGFYETFISRTIDCNGGNPSCHQGGLAVVESTAWDGNSVSSTITASNADGTQTMPDKGNCNAILESSLPHSQTGSGRDTFGTLNANCGQMKWQGNQEAFSGNFHVLEPNYAVRRLTPTECARLQGFPDWWCSDLDTPEPTEADIRFWSEVFETHRKAASRSSKPKSRKQIIKWLRCPHSDAAEYKMWGNGVALPCVFFVLAGIAYYAKNAPNQYSYAA